MANRRPPSGPRRPEYRNDRPKFNRGSVSPWQASNAGGALPTLLPLGGSSTEATLALANNLISNLLQSRQNTVPSLLDMPMRRDFRPDMGHFDRGFATPRMGNSFRRTGNYNRSGERINTRKQFRSNESSRNKQSTSKEADKAKPVNKESNEETNADEEVQVKTELMAVDDSEASKEEPKETPKGTPKETPKSLYHGINPDLLKCHICNKSMWDSRSFENHLNGRAHSIMMEKTAQSYDLTADTMRQEYKIREMKRARRSGQPASRSRDFYCAMCDMFAPDGTAHRTAIGHRKLKKYLHPSCALCREELPTRIELDQHRLTPTHLRNVQERDHESTDKPKAEVMVLSTLSMEQSYIREDRPQRRPRRSEKNADDAKEGEAQESEAVKTEEASEKKPPEDDNKLLDYKEGDDLTSFTYDMLPAYSRVRGVGESFLEEFKCMQCRLCRKLLDSEETAAVHLKTWRHHQLYVKMLKEKSGVEAPEGGKRSATDAPPGDDSTPKRRKTDDEEKPADNNDMEAEGDDNVGDQGGNGEFPHDDDDDNSWQGALDEVLDDEGINGDDQDEEQTATAEEPPAEVEEAELEPEPVAEPPSVVKKSPVAEPPSAAKKTPQRKYSNRGGRGRGRKRF